MHGFTQRAHSLLRTYCVSGTLPGVGNMTMGMTDKVHALRSSKNRPDGQGDGDGMVGGRSLEAVVPQVGLRWWEVREGLLEEVISLSTYLSAPVLYQD